MKKTLSYLLTVLLTLVIVGKVSAVTFKEGDAMSIYNSYWLGNSGLNFGGTGYGNTMHDFQDKTGTVLTSYCFDPQVFTGSNYKVVTVLSDSKNPYDIGLLAILENGYSKNNTSYTYKYDGKNSTISGNDYYLATSIASRAYWSAFAFNGTNAYNFDANYASAVVSIGRDWLFDEWYYVASDGKAINKAAQFVNGYTTKTQYNNKYKSIYSNWFSTNYVNTSTEKSATILRFAKRLFHIGVEAAYDAKKGVARPKSATVSGTFASGEGEVLEKDSTSVTRYISAYFTVENMGSKGYIDNITYSCTNCTAKGHKILSFEYQDAKGEWHEYNKDFKQSTNILATYTNGKDITTKKTVPLRFKVVTDYSDDDETKINIVVKYRYNNPAEKARVTGAIIKQKVSGTVSNSVQRFVVSSVEKGPYNDEFNSGDKVTITTSDCSSELSKPVCSVDDGGKGMPGNATATVEAPEKIKSCILDKSDDANNSYKLDTKDGVSNKYCSVFCKEDYAEIKLNPMITDVFCGDYFQLTAKIKGTKSCYTAGLNGNTTSSDNSSYAIREDLYIKDMKDIQKEFVDTKNKLTLYKAMAKAAESPTTTTTGNTCGENSCGTKRTLTVKWSGVEEISITFDSAGQGSTSKGTTSGSKSFSNSCTCSLGSDDKPICGGCTGDPDSDLTNWKNDLNNNKIPAMERKLKELETQYKNIIASYNACTTGWTNKFSFDHDIKFEYDEGRGSNSSTSFNTPYYDLIKDKEINKLQGEGVKETARNITVCVNGANNKYECIGESVTINKFADNTAKDEYNYNSDYAGAFANRKYITCTASGCGNSSDLSNRKVSKAKFVKKTVSNQESYITPTIFYHIGATGKVTVTQNYPGATPIENGLPVSLNAIGGGTFKMTLERFGEYYTDGSRGRIFDVTSNTASLGYVLKATQFSGDYECHYLTDCQCPNCKWYCDPTKGKCEFTDKECPNCDFTCVNCIFNLNELQLNGQTISTSNIGTSGSKHNYGYNWITGIETGKLSFISDKAEETIKEINDKNDTIYNDVNKTGNDSSLGFSIRLDSNLINEIKNHNENQLKVGGYADNSLVCYDDGDYKGIYCYSNYIDDLLENSDYAKNITVKDSRISRADREAGIKPNSKGYWELWSDSHTMPTGNVIGGPAWK